MRLKPGDKVKVVCDCVGEVLEDPTQSIFSVIIKFGDSLARVSPDGYLLGMKHIRLVKIDEDETYERP